MLQDDLLLSLPLLLQQYLQQEQVKDTGKVKQFSTKEFVKIMVRSCMLWSVKEWIIILSAMQMNEVAVEYENGYIWWVLQEACN